MYTREKLYREQNYKSRKAQQNNMPSFSSTLLDEIYRSIDGNAEDFKAYEEKPVKRQGGVRAKKITSVGDDEIASFRRACLVEKWMEKEAHEKVVAKTRPPPSLPELDNKSLHDNDLLFFSSTSSSSDSSGALSSSDTEFFGSTTKPKVSCFSTRPKSVRTGGVSAGREECDSLFDDDYENRERKKAEDELIKSKSRALKIYANLKKVKQPISPGGRLTSFINSLFSNANGKKSKNLDANKGFEVQDLKSAAAAAAASSSTCSSASSFSRSCLSKYSPKSREKMRNGVQRSVRFHPVSVIVDEDSRPCGHKCVYGEDSDRHATKNALEELKLSTREKNRKVEEAARNALKGYYLNKRGDEFSTFRKIQHEEDEDDEDGMSDSSSDLFELDHLALFGNNRFCEELPVYETTHLDKNLAIASRLIR
ncbi:protein BIG GRAIN 1-like B [Sesamum alatum]|uniref:Protein BIG GRAIN 1-like B n=1 Tax=Sesamum alatum TaxID=300844 RepID=A0AAE2C8J3_9LAMI|nr:protein BIG GRAIN 1-like B [Sesamum alatum]